MLQFKTLGETGYRVQIVKGPGSNPILFYKKIKEGDIDTKSFGIKNIWFGGANDDYRDYQEYWSYFGNTVLAELDLGDIEDNIYIFISDEEEPVFVKIPEPVLKFKSKSTYINHVHEMISYAKTDKNYYYFKNGMFIVPNQIADASPFGTIRNIVKIVNGEMNNDDEIMASVKPFPKVFEDMTELAEGGFMHEMDEYTAREFDFGGVRTQFDHYQLEFVHFGAIQDASADADVEMTMHLKARKAFIGSGRHSDSRQVLTLSPNGSTNWQTYGNALLLRLEYTKEGNEDDEDERDLYLYVSGKRMEFFIADEPYVFNKFISTVGDDGAVQSFAVNNSHIYFFQLGEGIQKIDRDLLGLSNILNDDLGRVYMSDFLKGAERVAVPSIVIDNINDGTNFPDTITLDGLTFRLETDPFADAEEENENEVVGAVEEQYKLPALESAATVTKANVKPIKSLPPTVYDPLMASETDTSEYLKDADNVVFLIGAAASGYPKSQMKAEYLDATGVAYECKKEMGLRVTPNDVHMDQPYYRLKLITGTFLIPFSDFFQIVGTSHQLFSLVEDKSLPFTAGRRAISAKGEASIDGYPLNLVGMDHCSAGTDKKTYRAEPVSLASNGGGNGSGGSRRKRRRTAKAKNRAYSKKSRKNIRKSRRHIKH